MSAFKSTCTQEQFEAIVSALDKTRASSDTVKVPREALAHLLRDHGDLHSILKTGC